MFFSMFYANLEQISNVEQVYDKFYAFFLFQYFKYMQKSYERWQKKYLSKLHFSKDYIPSLDWSS